VTWLHAWDSPHRRRTSASWLADILACVQTLANR
jgi:hypothetical protein